MSTAWTHAFAVAAGFLLALLLGSLGIIGAQHDAITRYEHVLRSFERSHAVLHDRVAALEEGCCAGSPAPASAGFVVESAPSLPVSVRRTTSRCSR